MNIIIRDKSLAALYVPDRPTAAFRIFGSDKNNFGKENYEDLKKSKNYLYTFEYAFDDVDPNDGWEQSELEKWVLFDEKIAEKALDDFVSCKDDVKAILVHCWAGKSRSVALALAFNRIFDLGEDPNEFMDWDANPNAFVYATLLETAIEKGYC